MILPSKHISAEQALVGVGAIVLREVDKPQTVTSLWEKVRPNQAVGAFDRFVLALDMLHIIGAIRIKDGLIERATE